MRRSWILPALALLAGLAAGPAAAKDYLVVGAKPNRLFLVDAASRSVVKQYTIPGEGSPFSIAVSPDGHRAYVLTEHWSAVSGIDLDSGQEVFRAELSTPEERVRSIGGLALSRDGSELFVQQSPTKMLPSEYTVEPARVAVYRTDAGTKAQPARQFEIPRRVILMVPSVDGKILYALGWDLYSLDPKDGHILKTEKVLHWDRANASKPDILDVWPDYELSNVLTTPYYYQRTDVPAGSPGSARTGILTLDLATGAFAMKDFEDTAALIFSSVANPKRRGEVYGVYSTLSKIDATGGKLDRRIDLDHTYYAVNVSSDGSELYAGGAMSDIAVYGTSDLVRRGDIKLPGDGDMAVTSFRVIQR